ncbi:unnamed protein product [Thlaspi arvense]|uniref:Uncharacterized protein n=1 Tax=Thlaspi arvense TaxID=13288 RepID=A0AAU9RPC1_THLAR|nr:unnamed protein product [Thlaspi arvense]
MSLVGSLQLIPPPRPRGSTKLFSSTSLALAIPSFSSFQPLTTPSTQSKFVRPVFSMENQVLPFHEPMMYIDESDLIFLLISVDDPQDPL